MIEDEFEDGSSSSPSDGDEELIIKPPQSSSELDSVLYRKDNKRRYSEEYKCCKKHHHHHRHHHHYHSDSSSKYQNIEGKSFHYTDYKNKNKEFRKDFTDLEMIGSRSKKLMKTITEWDKEKYIKSKEITDVRDIKFVKDIKDNRKYRNEEKSTHFFEEMKAEWRNKRLLWLQRQKYHDTKLQTEKEDLQDKKCENCTNEKKVTDHLEIDDEKNYTLISLVSSEDENMDCEEKEKKDKSIELIDEKNYQNYTTTVSGNSTDNGATSRSVFSDEDSIGTESSSESENVLQEETMSLEIAEKATATAVIKENSNMKRDEENAIPSVSKEKCPFQEPNVHTPQLPVYCPAIQGCRSIDGFQVLNRIEEGTYGVVYRARDKETKEIVALKRLKMEREKEGFPITSLREINTLLKAQHPNIVTVREIVVGSNMDRIYIVMDYVEHDLKSLMKTMPRPFLIGEVKTLLRQLLCAVAHLHDNWILHRDLKTSNLLLSHEGILKVGDFGLAREYGSPLKSYTPVVVTLWYRAPELLLGAKKYSTSIDMWSVGCIFGELLTKNALFPGKSESDQINRIFKDLGTPSENIWPGYSELPLVQALNITQYPYNNLKSRFSHAFSDLGFDLLNKFLTYNPARRISAEKAISHDFFNEKPKPIPSNMFPTWPARSEQEYRSARSSPKPPLGGIHYSRQ